MIDDPTGGIRAGLIWGGTGSFALFAALLLALVAWRRGALRAGGLPRRLLGQLPPRSLAALERAALAFAEGVSWPRERWRGAGIVLASVAIKLLAATHLLWAGLSIGVLLLPEQYLFLVVFLGFVAILGHFLRFVGSFVVGGVFALGLFDVAAEPALAMVLIVEAANLLSIAAVGAIALWAQGVALGDIRRAGMNHVR